MKLIHLSDLHLGKRVNEFSMLGEQRAVLEKIRTIVSGERPDAVILAGDIYDRPAPPAEAVELLDDFLVGLSRLGTQVFVIAGNHDSAERLAFAGRLIEKSGVHLAPAYSGKVEPITWEDAEGPVHFWLLPFLRPASVRPFFPDEEVGSYTDAVRLAIEKMQVDPTERNVLVTHQFVTGAETAGSEEMSVGGTENVDASVFADFDYVALGHIHGAQNIGSERIRYSGTPLKYSFSEVRQEKSLTVAELGKKGELTIRTVPLRSEHDLKEIKGTYDELTFKGFYDGTDLPDSYLRVILTDEEDVPEALQRLRVIYPLIMKLEYDNVRTRYQGSAGEGTAETEKTPLELFSDFYEKQNGSPLTEEQRAYMQKLIEEVWKEERE